jgi:WD40 repeat protein
MQHADRDEQGKAQAVSGSSRSELAAPPISAGLASRSEAAAGERRSAAGWTSFADPSAVIPSDLGHGPLSRASEDFGFGVGSPVDLPPGTDLGGITIVRAIGTGGMGRVYEARQQAPSRLVAVKVMRDGIVSAAQMRRFEYEAQVLARLRHPHVAQIHALSAARIGPLTIPYFVMELVPDAKPLTLFCAAGGFSIRSRVGMLRKVAAAVAHGHQKGVIHRDLKPGNILVGGDGEPKVIDFGIARSTDGDAAITALHLTDPGQVVGTLHYMSPEQLAGHGDDIDARSDVYALGLVLYELLTGTLPYDLRGRSVVDAIRVVQEEEPPVRVTVARAVCADPEVTADDARSLGVIVAKCLEKRAADRYATAAELEAELSRWLAGEPIVARPLSASEQLLRLARRHRAAAAAMGASLAAMLAAIVGVSFFAVRAEREGAAARSQLYRATVLLAAASRDRGAEAEARHLSATARKLSAETGARRPLELACLETSLDDAIAVLDGHTAMVQALAWAPHLPRLVSAGEDGSVRLWEAVERGGGFADGWRQTVLATLDAEVCGIAFSPDGDRVAVACGDGGALVWDCVTRRERVRCVGHKGIVYGISFSPDGGQLVTGGRDGTVRIWDAATGREELSLRGNGGTVYSVAYSPDGGVIASASQDATVRLWDAATGAARAVLRGHGKRVFSVAFSPHGDCVATAAEDATVRVWDVTTGEERAVFQHPVRANAVTFLADGRVVTATHDAVLRIWDPATGVEVGRRLGHGGGIWSVASFGQGPWLASGGTDATVRIWRNDFGSNPALACGGDARAVTHDPTGSQVAVATTSGIEVLEAVKGRRIASLSHDGRQVNDVRFFPDGRLLAAACDRGIVEVWPMLGVDKSDRDAAVSEPRRFEAHSRRVYSIDVDATGERLATAGEDKAARIWRWGDEPTEIAAFKHEKRVLCSRFSADGSMLYTACEDRMARLWEIPTGHERVRFEGHREQVNWLALTPDGKRLATASSDGTVRLWDAATGALQATLTGPSLQVWKVAFTPDGSRLVAVSADGVVYLWDASSGETVSVLRGHAAAVWGVSVSPRGDTLVSGGDARTLRLWGVTAAQVQGR